MDIGEDDASGADENIVINGNWAEGIAVGFGVDIVFVIVDQNLAGNPNVVADLKGSSAIEEGS